jgi:hypothetical protein
VLSAGGAAEGDVLHDNCTHLYCFMGLLVMIIIGLAVFFFTAPSQNYLSAPTLRPTFVSVFTETCLHFAGIVFGHHGILKNEKKKICR